MFLQSPLDANYDASLLPTHYSKHPHVASRLPGCTFDIALAVTFHPPCCLLQRFRRAQNATISTHEQLHHSPYFFVWVSSVHPLLPYGGGVCEPTKSHLRPLS
mmetsp:Transcript_26520/g.43497  ORF Transcript_26520/g.43497 Transcript_26520/m.43497 type:complete len:103 (-) Transcript_26520:314-622(-)